MPIQRISDEEKEVINKRLSAKAKLRWADPANREKMCEAQSIGSRESWADPEKTAQRLRRREERAHELGFKSYGALVSWAHMKKTAEKCGITVDEYIALNTDERTELRAKHGAIIRRKTKK